MQHATKINDAPATKASASDLNSASSEHASERFWNVRYEILREMHEKGENVNLSQTAKIGDVFLGSWLARQRHLRRLGKLTLVRSLKLESIGVIWSPKTPRDIWNEHYAILAKRHQDGMTLDLPTPTIVAGLDVGRWAAEQRKYRANGEMAATSIKKLDAIGFPWAPRTETKWQTHFAILQKHRDAGKDVNDRPAKIYPGAAFASWILRQCDDYAAGKLSAERLKQLADIGFTFGNRHDVSWSRHFAILERKYLAGEDVNVVKGTSIAGLDLGGWVRNQRQARRKGKLSEERIAKLEKIGFHFEPAKEEWARPFGILKRLHACGKDVNLPGHAVIDGVKIGAWIANQRYKRHPVRTRSPERTALLESLGLKWSMTSEPSLPVKK